MVVLIICNLERVEMWPQFPSCLRLLGFTTSLSIVGIVARKLAFILGEIDWSTCLFGCNLVWLFVALFDAPTRGIVCDLPTQYGPGSLLAMGVNGRWFPVYHGLVVFNGLPICGHITYEAPTYYGLVCITSPSPPQLTFSSILLSSHLLLHIHIYDKYI